MQNKKIRAALVGLFVAASVMAAAQGRVNGVSVSKLTTGVEVMIQGSELKEPKATFGDTDKIYVLEFDSPFSGKQETISVRQNGLETVRTAKLGSKAQKTKFVFTFNKGVNASIAKVEKGYKVTFESSDLKLAMKESSILTTTLSTPRADIGSHVALGHSMLMTAFQPFPKELMKEFAPIQQSLTTLPMALAVNTSKIPATLTTAAHTFASTKDVKTTKTEKKIKRSSSTASSSVSQPNAAATFEKNPSVDVKTNEGRVSLDFVNTDVVQILKSLARQTNSNIVTSPDVSGKLSIKIDNVSIKESLNLVTSLAGLRFAMIGKTYVVTSPAKFLETMRSVQGAQEEITLSRIVPIFSGQGTQIKVAVLKSVSSENAFGRFELVLPSEKTMVVASQKVGGTAKKEDDKSGTDIATQTSESATDAYVMLIGSPGRLDEVEQLVQGIDRQLCSALGVKVPTNNSQVLATYFVHGGRASDLVDAVAGKGKTMVGSVDLRSTPQGSISRQAIVVSGREDEVGNVMKALAQLDGEETSEVSEIKMVDLLYVDPRALREFIVAQVPGVTCVIAPNGVMNSRAYIQDAMRTQSEQRGTDQPAPQGGGTAAASGQNQSQSSTQQSTTTADAKQSKDNADTGVTLPFNDFEKTAVPMRLIVKGSKSQVEKALQLISTTDIAPKQVALEMRVMELSREEMLKLGINWNLFTSGAIKTISLNNGQSTPSNTIGATVSGRNVSGDVGASLDSISNGSNLISRPNLLCNDGRESEVFVGDAIRYVESIISSQNGPSVTTGTVRAGVRLSCFPRIGGDDTLNLDIRTGITYLKGFTAVPQIGGQLPQTSERTAQNSITLKDGETFAIGGLIQQQDVVALSGLPILKDLPIIGQFFRRTTKDKIKTELVIFVTAKVVGPGKSKSLPMAKDSDIMKHKLGLPGGKD
jgi:type II secretory pathway component GspD/PulD (secretin)